MRKALRSVIGVVAVALLAGVVSASAGAAELSSVGHAISNEITEDAGPWAYTKVCTTEPGSVATVQLVVDVSLSLETNDPLDSRKDLLRQWVSRLAQFDAEGLPVRVTLMTFGSTTTTKVPWSDLDDSSLDRLYSEIDVMPRDEMDTDHVGAFLAAKNEFAAESRRLTSAGLHPCPLMLVFTDGQYAFDSKSPEFRRERGLPLTTPYSPLPVNRTNRLKIVEAGLKLACGEAGRGGIIRDLRLQEVSILAVLLGQDVDFRLMQEMTAGDGWADGDSSGGCDLPEYGPGVTGPWPPERPPPPPPPPPPCAGGSCVTSVELPQSRLATLSQSEIRLAGGNETDSRFKTLTLIAPDGSRVPMTPSKSGPYSVNVGDVTAAARLIGDGGVAVTLSASTGGALGDQWRVEIDRTSPDVSVALGNTSLTSDLHPELAMSTEVVSGETSQVSVVLVHADGSPATEQETGLIAMSAAWDGSDVSTALELADGGGYTGEVTGTQFDRSSDSAVLVVTPSADDPVSLEPVPLTVSIDWPGYPSLTFPTAVNGIVRVPTFETPGSVAIPYELTAPDDERGCARLLTDSLSSEGRSAVLRVDTPQEDCLAGGSTVERTLELRFVQREETYLCGEASFELNGEATESPRVSSVTICASTLRNQSPVTRFVSLAVMVLSAILPVVLLALLNRRLGGIPSLMRMRVALVSVSIHGSAVRKATGQSILVPDDFTRDPEKARRSSNQLHVAGNRMTVESRPAFPMPGPGLPHLLFSGPATYVLPTGGQVIVGHGRDVLHTGPLTSPLSVPIGLDSVWFVIPSMASGVAGVQTATLVVLRVVGAGTSAESLADDVRMALTPELLEPFVAVGTSRHSSEF